MAIKTASCSTQTFSTSFVAGAHRATTSLPVLLENTFVCWRGAPREHQLLLRGENGPPLVRGVAPPPLGPPSGARIRLQQVRKDLPHRALRPDEHLRRSGAQWRRSVAQWCRSAAPLSGALPRHVTSEVYLHGTVVRLEHRSTVAQ
eukprot:6032813-Pyramimonas_sp.AAC.1